CRALQERGGRVRAAAGRTAARRAAVNRREFLARVGAAASAGALCAAWPPARAAACGIPSGVQLYTVRDALQRDARATLAALHAIGIVDAELYGLNGREGGRLFGLTAAELRGALGDNGI